MRSAIIALLIISLISSVASAGEILEYTCDKCAFKSDPLRAGYGFAGIEYSIIYCDNCKTYYSVPTKIAFKTALNEDIDDASIVKSTGIKQFLGKERLSYLCPECKSDAFVYDERICPICRKGNLQRRDMGIWD